MHGLELYAVDEQVASQEITYSVNNSTELGKDLVEGIGVGSP